MCLSFRVVLFLHFRLSLIGEAGRNLLVGVFLQGHESCDKDFLSPFLFSFFAIGLFYIEEETLLQALLVALLWKNL